MTGSIDVGSADLGREMQGVGFDGPASASSTVTGLMSAADKAKLDGIEAGAAGDMTPAELLTAIKTVDGAGSGLDADLLDGQSSAYFLPAASYTAADVLAKVKTVDGAGSGLDADLLNGQTSSFYQNATNLNAGTIADARLPTTLASKTFTDSITIQGTSAQIYLKDTDASAYDFWVHVNSNRFYVLCDRTNAGIWNGPYPLELQADVNVGILFGNVIWTTGNDGSGSGLDADLLDGYQSSQANVASTVAVRDGAGDIFTRLIRSEYASPSQCNYFVGMNALGAGADNYHRPMTIAQAATALASTLASSGAVYDQIENRGSAWGQYWVANNTPGTIAAMAVGSVGSYAMCNYSGGALAPGGTVAGSTLTYNNAYDIGGTTHPIGTWRLMGETFAGGDVERRTSLFLRIS